MSNIHTLGIQGSILIPSSDSYEDAVAQSSQTLVSSPILCRLSHDSLRYYSLLIQFALSGPPLELAVKGGSCHTSIASSSNGGLVIDLSRLNKVTLSEDKKSVAVQDGSLWGDVYSALEKHQLAISRR